MESISIFSVSYSGYTHSWVEWALCFSQQNINEYLQAQTKLFCSTESEGVIWA